MKKFPKGFLFGSGTSAHQIEGGNYNSDWYAFEKAGHTLDGKTSEIACDSWNNWRKDIELIVKSGQNAYRFSIEWAKIEPKKGKFDQSAINHYREILIELKKNNITPLITLWHFTNPLWVAKSGGFANNDNVKYFARYCKKVVAELSRDCNLWATLNEPNVYVLKGYIEGEWNPGQKNVFLAIKVWQNLIKAHNLAYRHIKLNFPEIQVGAVINVAAFKPKQNNFFNKLIVKTANYFDSQYLIKKISNRLDFLGLNYYMKFIIDGPFRRYMPQSAPKNDYGWSINQEGLLQVILENARWGKPIYITENGVADKEDRFRSKFIEDAFKYMAVALEKNIYVQGYFYWSLLDNFEWAAGYTQKFGLHTIDRKPRPSVKNYKNLIEKLKQ